MAEQESDGARRPTKVQEAAANVQQATQHARRRDHGQDERRGGRAALLRGDRRARPRRGRRAVGRRAGARTCAARSTCIAPEGVREFIGELLEAMPDLRHASRLDDDRRTSAAPCSGASRGTFAGPGHRSTASRRPAIRSTIEGSTC